MCVHGGLAEDNARFILLAFVLTAYMLAGAALFQKLESDLEIRQAAEFWKVYHAFRRHHLRGSSQALQRLHELLYAYGNASAIGIINKRRRWDFSGSFHFVGTIVSTIGYGSTAPQTSAGKAAVILYGFFGCSGGILFFNLFLERIITFLAWILRSLHLRRLKRRLRQTTLASSRRISRNSRSKDGKSLPDILDDDEEDVGLEHWKPSVYWVMLYLSLASCAVACTAAAMYAPLEDWSYLEALYFCFVSFATIGFGDYVSLQRPYYPYVHLYRLANFMFLVIGCCCIYSLLNVTSIVIKQGLNYVIQKLSCPSRSMAAPHLPRRKSSVSAIYYAKRRPTKLMPRDGVRPSIAEDIGTPRRMSGELISMKEFLSANKVSLAVMQKQLYETANLRYQVPSSPVLPILPLPIVSQQAPISQAPASQPQSHGYSGSGPGVVGPLAIASEKLESANAKNSSHNCR